MVWGPARGVGRALPLAQPPPPQLLAQPPPQPCIPTTKVGAWQWPVFLYERRCYGVVWLGYRVLAGM